MTEVASRQALEELHLKYLEILALRLSPGPEDETRARMAALSSRFPGALRELDDLELRELARRSTALEGVLRSGVAPEPWMEAVAAFHALARGALCAKRWLSGRKEVDASVERAYAAALPGLSFPDDARRWQGELQRIASPPRGRVTDLVLAEVALLLRTTEREARLLVFGVPRRERASARRSA